MELRRFKMAKTIFNLRTRQWKRSSIPNNEEIEAIVGKVSIRIDSDGNVEIDKTLTAQEKAAIEAL